MALKRFLFFVFLFMVFESCFLGQTGNAQQEEDYQILREIILNEFQDYKADQHGGVFEDVLTKFPSQKKEVVIALAACLDMGAEVDLTLLNMLAENSVKATIFTDKAWLSQNLQQLQPFLTRGFFRFENHGTFCRALSVDGEITEQAPKTSNLEEVFEEIEENARVIERFSGRLPRFYRTAYGYYDDVALKIVTVLGYQAIEGDLKLKSKDTESEDSMKLFLSRLQPGAIIVIPANRPGASDKWFARLLDGLQHEGYSIVALEDVLGSREEEY